jgi:hypothetical protein
VVKIDATGSAQSSFSLSSTATLEASKESIFKVSVSAQGGTINDLSENLRLAGGGSYTGTTISTQAGTILTLEGAGTQDTFTDLTFNTLGSSYVRQNGANVTLDNVTVGTYAFDAGDLTVPSGTTLAISKTLNEDSAGSLKGGGSITVQNNATMGFFDPFVGHLTLLDVNITNNGTINFGASTAVPYARYHTFTSNGIVNFTLGGLSITDAGGVGLITAFHNDGTLNFDTPPKADGSYATVTIDLPFYNSGTMNLTQGSLKFTSDVQQYSGGQTNLNGAVLWFDGTFTIDSGSTFAGTGVINANSIVNNGTLRIGRTGDPTGNLTIFGTGAAGSGDYTQGSTGTLQLTANGKAAGQYTKLIVADTVTLAGTLSLTIGGGYTPAANDVLDDVITWTTLTGSFGTTPAGWTPSTTNGYDLKKN